MADLMKALLHSACQVVGYTKDESASCKIGNVAATAFRMPVHYPRYSKKDYEAMEEWRLDLLFLQYGLCFQGSLAEKRAYAIGAFLWPDQY
ncbi:hypothetical protein LINGRAHAP2_LOCUS16642 [Linum grandiflorum]